VDPCCDVRVVRTGRADSTIGNMAAHKHIGYPLDVDGNAIYSSCRRSAGAYAT
jgi:hypothetical protein